MELSGKQKRILRGLGHGLRPLVTVGKQGVTAPLIGQVEDCLLAYELLKIRVLETSPLDRKTVADRICQATGGAMAQQLGRTLLIYRPHPEAPQIALPSYIGRSEADLRETIRPAACRILNKTYA